MSVVAIICVCLFVPWMAGCDYFSPLPDTVQQQVDKAMDYKLDGIIVYVDKKGRPPEFYAAGWNNSENKTPAYPMRYSKSPASANYI